MTLRVGTDKQSCGMRPRLKRCGSVLLQWDLPEGGTCELFADAASDAVYFREKDAVGNGSRECRIRLEELRRRLR